MGQRWHALWEWLRSPGGMRVVKYTSVSVISFFTSLTILSIIYGVFKLWSEPVSALVANLLAGIPSYLLNRQWVWGKSGRSHLWREIVPFWVTSITGIGFALVTTTLAHNFADAHHLQHLARTLLVDGANTAAFAILWLVKFAILNRIFSEWADVELGTDTSDAAGEHGPEVGQPAP